MSMTRTKERKVVRCRIVKDAVSSPLATITKMEAVQERTCKGCSSRNVPPMSLLTVLSVRMNPVLCMFYGYILVSVLQYDG